MQDMARYGRNGDTRMAHLTPGETVVPREVLRQNPKVARGLGKAFQDAGSDPRRYVVGSGQNSINPVTGKPEFFFDKILPFLGKLASNPTVQGAIGNVALRKLQGKDVSLRDALLGGAIGGGLGAMSGRGTGVPFLDNMLDADPGISNKLTGGSNPLTAFGGKQGSNAAEQIIADKIKDAAGVERAEGLMGIGDFFGIGPSDKGLGRMLNSKFGESIAMGLGSELLDRLFSEDVDPDPYGNRARFERGAGEGPISLKRRPLPDRRVPQYANGGVAYFPRRNGGIMPSEGSGTKDDVPAMLTAGEFVMTRDAVKGAGNGNLQSGINKMYGMMDRLERKA